MNLKSKKGFTLVELIIVIAILGIIALIAVPNLTGIQQRSQVNADLRTAEQIGKAVRIWLTDTGAGTAKTRAAAIENWTALADIDNDLDQYVSVEYTPKSYLGTDGKYYVKLTEADATGTVQRVVVGIGEGTFSTTAYTAGNAAGIAYVEGISELTDDNIEGAIS